MTFTIYTLGDLQIFWSVLNAVAMVFQSSMFDPAQGAGAFVMGGLISLLFIIIPPMMGKKLDLVPMFVVFLIFFVGIVPKARVQLEDVYTGNVTAVDNVPMIVAFPGSVAGMVSKAITDKVETSFSTVSGSYLSMGAEGFANPLKLLLTFRGSNNVPSPFPYLSQSTMDFIRYCAIPAPNFDIKAMNASTDIYNIYFPTLLVSGITTYYNAANPNGFGVSCTFAQTQLAADAQLSINAAVLDPIVKAQMDGAVQSLAGAGPTTQGITDAFNMAVAGTGIGQNAQSFMMNAIAKEPIEKGVTCATAASSNLTACEQAVLIKVAQEKQAIDSAASATIFTKTIIPAMNILLALFYAFSPILLAVALMSAGHGVKIIMGFLLFGVWTQSWMPIAAVINYMIELQTNYEVSRFASAGGITEGNVWQFYDTIRTKIGLASELLAMTPMISFGLLSGSMMALTGISQKFGARDYVNEGNVAPDGLQTSPVASVGAYTSLESKHSLASVGGRAGAGELIDSRGTAGGALDKEIGVKTATSSSVAHDQQLVDSASKSYSDAKATVKSGSHGNGYSQQDFEAVGNSLSTTDSEAWKRSEAVVNEATQGIDTSKVNKVALGAYMSGALNTPSLSPVQMQAGIQASAGVDKATAHKIAANFKKAESNEKSATHDFKQTLDSKSGNQLSKNIDLAYQKQNQAKLERAENELHSAQESLRKSSSFDGSTGVDAKEKLSVLAGKAITDDHGRYNEKMDLAAQAEVATLAQSSGMSTEDYNAARNEKLQAMQHAGLSGDNLEVMAGLSVLADSGEKGLAAIGHFMSGHSGNRTSSPKLSAQEKGEFKARMRDGGKVEEKASDGTKNVDKNTAPADQIGGPKTFNQSFHEKRESYSKTRLSGARTGHLDQPEQPNLPEESVKQSKDKFDATKAEMEKTGVGFDGKGTIDPKKVQDTYFDH